MRNILYDPSLLYSPADGVVLYAHDVVKPDDFLEIKGKEFTLSDILNDPKYDQPSLVVGVFMTSYDIHVNRVPTNAYYLEERPTDSIYTHNDSMLTVENDLFTEFGYDREDLGYIFANERKISTFYSPQVGGRFYIVQIGDKDIDVIQNWGVGNHLFQGERMGAIRWGSQVDLIIPLGKTKFEIMVE